jgi:CRISPR-associated protein Csb2
MLAIEVVFLTGRYVATAYNNRHEGEWPPHPARVYSALAATHFAAAADAALDRPGERGILEWLERQGAPSIRASDASQREIVTVFVPVNDVALTNVDDEAGRLNDARTALAQAEASGDTKAVRKWTAAVKKADAAFQRAAARATAVPPKPLNPRYGQRLLPEYRGRQPRTFPSVTPDEPRVTYIWPDAAPSDGQRALLEGLLRRVVRIGHSSSLVSARLVDHPDSPVWRPAGDGEDTLRIVEPGQLEALERAFAQHHEIAPRVMPYVSQSYARERAEATPPQSRSAFSDNWLVLRRVEGPLFPMTAAAGVARAIRRTLMSYADEPIPELLCGHTPDRRPSQRPHLAIVPLPFVGHPHASGAILGVGLVLPRIATAGDKRSVYAAVAKWEQAFRQEAEDTPAIRLNLGGAGELYLERVEWASVQASLQSRTWCRPCKIWYSVTPLALDRNPGELRSRDPLRQTEAINQAVEVICRACERIALPRPRYVEILPAAPWAGAEKARRYPPYPGDATRTQRVLTHARLEFDEPVNGPSLLGAGRYIGLGLFRPEASR